MNKTVRAIPKILINVAIGVLVISGVAFADSFVEPASAPPGGNVPAPVNVGGTLQVKSGNFWAAAIGVDNGFRLGTKANSVWDLEDNLTTVIAQRFCVGTDTSNCITTSNWPGNGSGTMSCHVERMITHISFRNGQDAHHYNYNDLCQVRLSQSLASQGWFASGSDLCAMNGSDCDYDDPVGLQCYYMRMVCSGTPVPVTEVSNDVSAGSAVTSSSSGTSGTTGGGGGGGTSGTTFFQ